MVNIRHNLNDFLLNYKGHIGYSVRKTERRRGIMSTSKNIWDNIYTEKRVENIEELKSIFNNGKDSTEYFINRIIDGEKVLDYGAGFGRNTIEIAKKEAEIYISDISKISMEYCKDYLNSKGYKVNFVEYKNNVLNLDNNHISKILVWSVLDHMSLNDVRNTVGEFYRVLNWGGLILASFDIESINEPHIILDDNSIEFVEGLKKGSIFRNFSKEEIFNIFKKFEIVKFEEYEDEYVILVRKMT